MERTKKKEATEVDLSKPISGQSLPTIAENDCTGKLWDPKDKACMYCAEFELCGILYEAGVRERASALRINKTAFFSEDPFHALDREKLKEQYLGCTVSELFEAIQKTISKHETVTDEEIVGWIKEFVSMDSEIAIKGGILISKDGDSTK